MIYFQNAGTPEAQAAYGVTAMDADNIYVGNAAAYYKSGNGSTYEYVAVVIP